jgi:hypothetical protein
MKRTSSGSNTIINKRPQGDESRQLEAMIRRPFSSKAVVVFRSSEGKWKGNE